MKDDNLELWQVIAIPVVMFAILFGVIFGAKMFFGSWGCNSRWEKSGLETDFGLMQGCLVKTPSGRWIPENRVRETDLSK